MTNLRESTDPNRNANVFASAGSGKTWLLITRICRLLLAGAAPQHILAITFTRKSAADMRARLHEKLSNWAVMPTNELQVELENIDEPTTAENISLARSLYEKILFSGQPIRISTFHAFCEEVVRAFPLESELPTMFDLTEHTQLYANEAFKRLLQQSEQSHESDLQQAMQELYEFCFGFNNTKKALLSFLHTRTEWRVYIQGSTNPVEHAMQSLYLNIGKVDTANSITQFQSVPFIESLQRQLSVLLTNKTKTNLSCAERIEQFLQSKDHSNRPPLHLLQDAFLTKKLEPRKLNVGKKWSASLGAETTEQFIADHEKIAAAVSDYLDQQKHAKFLRANRAWFYAGQLLLQHYQQVKHQQGVVDFNDLEWETYRLLQQQDHALWVQYKLGERIRHFLVDEFQDTNPIQWHLLKPLIDSSSEQHQTDFSSLFLVGDIKQSIYRFRGANPEIQRLAADWANKSINSREYENNTSWRSVPAIIDCVNQIFSHSSNQANFPTFHPHRCQFTNRWGRVEIHPLIKLDRNQTQAEFRDPLIQARIDNETSAHFYEGVFIATQI